MPPHWFLSTWPGRWQPCTAPRGTAQKAAALTAWSWRSHRHASGWPSQRPRGPASRHLSSFPSCRSPPLRHWAVAMTSEVSAHRSGMIGRGGRWHGRASACPGWCVLFLRWTPACTVSYTHVWQMRSDSSRSFPLLGSLAAKAGRGGVYLAKVHRLDTFTTESWTDRRTRAGLPGSDDELDELVDSWATPRLGHCDSLFLSRRAQRVARKRSSCVIVRGGWGGGESSRREGGIGGRDLRSRAGIFLGIGSGFEGALNRQGPDLMRCATGGAPLVDRACRVLRGCWCQWTGAVNALATWEWLGTPLRPLIFMLCLLTLS